MKDVGGEQTTDSAGNPTASVLPRACQPALQVICLGVGGGPSEDNVTGFLVRSVASEWARGSLLAVDAGSHLAPIIRILERHFPSVSVDVREGGAGVEDKGTLNGTTTPEWTPDGEEDDSPPKPQPTLLTSGPFAGLTLPNASARANALHVLRSYISTYLITHPHLDHLSGFAINTAAFHATSRPKTLAALPSTVDAVKTHIFNDVIWPNLTDEDGGVGFVTFQRLKEGGDVMVGEGEGRGYIDVCDGLGVRAFKVSHGTCTKSPPSHFHRGSIAGLADTQSAYNSNNNININNNGGLPDHAPTMARSTSLTGASQLSTPGTPRAQSFHPSQPSPHISATEASCVVDSTAFFLRDSATYREALIFGDVEPDSLSLFPRTHLVWQEAARKIALHLLAAIFIECSYDDSQADPVLFGHLCPRHLIAELASLADMVREARAQRLLERDSVKKRKRSVANGGTLTSEPGLAQRAFANNTDDESERKRSRSLAGRSAEQLLRRSSVPGHTTLEPRAQSLKSASSSGYSHSLPHVPSPLTSDEPMQYDHFAPQEILSPLRAVGDTDISELSTNHHNNQQQQHQLLPLAGVKVVIIHIKDTLADGPHVSANILAQLCEHEVQLREEGRGLGCEFVIAKEGESYDV